jgi:hypothetical protein
MRSFKIKYYSGDQIMKDEMGVAFSTHGERSAYTGFQCENLRTNALLEDIGVEWRIILKCAFRNWNWAWAGLIRLSLGTGNRLL